MVITIVIEQKTQAPGHWLKRQIDTLPGRDYHRQKREVDHVDYSRGMIGETRQSIVFPRHIHYGPLHVTKEEEFDAWARPATASNGFSEIS